MAEHFMENLPLNNQNVQILDQESNAESALEILPFAQGPSQDIEIILPLPEQQISNLNWTQEGPLADPGNGPNSQDGLKESVAEDRQQCDPFRLTQPMVAKLC
jgi:hypothetical protein